MSQTNFSSFRAPKLSIPTNQKNQWYMTLWVQDPSHLSKYVRIKKMDDINTFQSHRERMKRAKYWLRTETFIWLAPNKGSNIYTTNNNKLHCVVLAQSLEKRKRLSVSHKTYYKYTYFLNGFLDWVNTTICKKISLTGVTIRQILDYRNKK